MGITALIQGLLGEMPTPRFEICRNSIPRTKVRGMEQLKLFVAPNTENLLH